MKKLVLLLITLGCLTSTYSQDNERPTKSRFWKSKLSTFTLIPGDILVYRVDDNGGSYDLQVNIKSYGDGIKYEYSIPTKGNRSSVSIDAASMNNSQKYTDLFSATTNTSTLWLSKKSYTDLASIGTTTMDFGTGVQTFNRGNTGTLKINYKGKQKILTLYNISTEEGPSRNLGVLTEENNPLIVTLNSGVRWTLKEVR